MLTGIKQQIEAFTSVPQIDNAVLREAAETLVVLEQKDENLGFWRRKGASSDPIAAAQKILTENGRSVSMEEAFKIVEHLSKLEAIKQTRRRFWVQVLVTVGIAALVALLLSGYFGSSDGATKMAYSLMGLVAGYWLK